MNLYQAIRDRLLAEPDRIVIEAASTRWSGAALDRRVAQYAGALLAAGVTIGDRVAVQVEKSVEVVAAYLATLRIGAVYLPLNTGYGPTEVRYFLQDATPSIVILDKPGEIGGDWEANRLCTMSKPSGLFKALSDLADASAATAAIAPRDPDDLAAICYTSGTTGRSKGAMITHRNLLSNARALIDIWQISDRDTLLHSLPLYHVHGLFVALHTALLAGAPIIFHEKFEAAAAVAALSGCSMLMGVPTYYSRLLDQPDFGPETCRQMRLFVSGSAPLLPETFEAFHQKTGHRIIERYGMTEAGMISSNRLDQEKRAGCVGWALPEVEIRIVDESGKVLPEGGIGSVEVKGPNVFKGYWHQPEKTAAEFRDDGFFITGDLGRLDERGALNLVGRAKDLIISGGLNVYPKEIELALDTLPGIEESAVIGLPHPDLGEAVTAIVTLRDQATFDAPTLIEALRSDLAGFKLPKQIFVIDELPRNAMGKVQKNLLREQFSRTYAKPDS